MYFKIAHSNPEAPVLPAAAGRVKSSNSLVRHGCVAITALEVRSVSMEEREVTLFMDGREGSMREVDILDLGACKPTVLASLLVWRTSKTEACIQN